MELRPSSYRYRRFPQLVCGTLLLALITGCAPAASAPTAPPAPAKPTAAAPAAPAKPASPVPASPAPASPAPAASPAAKPAAAASPSPMAAASPAAAPSAAPTSVGGYDQAAVASFYRGKTIRVLVGFSAGGAVDLAARLASRYLGKYIPGNPNVIVQNRPGAGGVVAANQVYSTEARDGTVLLAHSQGPMLPQIIEQSGVQFDSARFQWLGSMAETPFACIVRSDAGVNSIQDIIAGKEVAMGTAGIGSGTQEPLAVMNAALGTRFKLVSGYPSLAQVRLAIQSGEVDGFCAFADALLSIDRQMLEGSNPFARAIVVMSDRPLDHPFFRGVPTAESLAKDDEGRLLLRAIGLPDTISRPFGFAPEVPADRVAALRDAFARAMRDPELLAEAQRTNQSVAPKGADEVMKVVQEVLGLPAATKARLKQVLTAQS